MMAREERKGAEKEKCKNVVSILSGYKLVIAGVFIIAIVGLVLFSGGAPGSPEPAQLAAPSPSAQGNATGAAPVTAPAKAEKVEVYHFHRTQQCASCIRLGQLAEKTVNTHFADEMASGKLVFGHINYEETENADLSDRFGPTGASLWIGTTSSGGFSKEEDTNVWYKLQDEEGFVTYLKGVLEKRLAGDLS